MHKSLNSTAALRLLILMITLFVLPVTIGTSIAFAADDETSDIKLTKEAMIKYKINYPQAEKVLKDQDKAPLLYDKLYHSDISEFGGVWIGEQDGRVKLGLKSQPQIGQRDRTNTVLDNLNIADGVDTVTVSKSYAELLELQTALMSDAKFVDKSNPGWAFEFGLIPSMNKVYVGAPPEKNRSPEQKEFIKNILEAHYGVINLQMYPSQPVLEDDCNNVYCDAPLRGGVGLLKADNSSCSVGFIVRGYATGNRYALTAGHCSNGYTGATWYSRDSALFAGNQSIGPVTRNEFNNGVDAMIIRRDNSAWNTEGSTFIRNGQGYAGQSGPSRNTHWSINGVSSNSGLEGERVCMSGRTTGSSCGTIQAVNVAWSLNGITLSGTVRAAYCSNGGDSGGSVVRGNYTHHALGIHSGIRANTGECSYYKYYTGINTILNGFDNTFEVVTQ